VYIPVCSLKVKKMLHKILLIKKNKSVYKIVCSILLFVYVYAITVHYGKVFTIEVTPAYSVL